MKKKCLRRVLPIEAKAQQKKGTELYYTSSSVSLECYYTDSERVKKYATLVEELIPYNSNIWEQYTWYKVYECNRELV